jgi:hypothetical protein
MPLPASAIAEIVVGIVCVIAFLSIFISPFITERDWEAEAHDAKMRRIASAQSVSYAMGVSSPRVRAYDDADDLGEMLLRTTSPRIRANPRGSGVAHLAL